MTAEGENVAARSIVAFRLAEYEFGVYVEDMHEVVEYREPRPVPGGPEFLEGVLEVRGIVLPVLDLRARLGLEPTPADRDTRVLVISIAGERMGLVVDAVTDVVRLPPDTVSAPPEDLDGATRDHVSGFAVVDDREFLLLGLGGMLKDEERRTMLGMEADVGSAGAAPTDSPVAAGGGKAEGEKSAD